MRDAFFLGVILVVPAALVIALLYSLAKFVWAAYQDWRLFRELNVIQAESAARREQKRAGRQKRLDNGCEHAFGTGLGGFPPNACPKCGMEREKPMGRCDHVWRRKDGPVIGSYCEKCGKQYQPE